MKAFVRSPSATIASSGDGDGRVVTWDMVNVAPTDAGVALGLKRIFDDPIRKVTVVIEAGHSAYAEVQFYGDARKKEAELAAAGDLKDVWIRDCTDDPKGMSLYAVRMPLRGLSVAAYAPYVKMPGEYVNARRECDERPGQDVQGGEADRV